MRVRAFVVLTICFLAAVALHAQERPLVSPAQLITSLDEAQAVAEEAALLRSQFPDELSPSEFVQAVAILQRRCEPIIVLIAETTPPRELQGFAMSVAMGVKGVELGLWYYLYGIASGDGGYVNYGDQLLSQGRAELQVAQTLSADLR